MLQDNFFKIIDTKQNDTLHIVSVKLNDKHPVFAGHFPEQPVVPGVFTLQMIKECLEITMQKRLRYLSLQNCKFSNVIIPDANQVLFIEYEYEQTEQTVGLKVSVKSDETAYFSMKAKLSEVI